MLISIFLYLTDDDGEYRQPLRSPCFSTFTPIPHTFTHATTSHCVAISNSINFPYVFLKKTLRIHCV